MPIANEQPSDASLAASLAKLWPHREHESSALMGLLCRCGLHRWRKLDIAEMVPGKVVDYCFWCSKIRIDGTLHDP